MSLVTTELAPTTEPSPIVTPGRTTTLRPSHTLSPMTVGPLYGWDPGWSRWLSSSMTDANGAMSTLLPILMSWEASMDTPPFM